MSSSLLRALILFAILVTAGEVLSTFVHERGLSYFDEVLIENVLTAGLGGGLLYVYLEQRRQRTLSRMEEIAFLNHHIRNALQAIRLSDFASDSARLEIVSEASKRIETALERMSRQEHVSLEPLNVPQKQ